ERVPERLDHLGVERLTGRDEVPHATEVVALERRELRLEPVLRRRLAQDGDAQPGDELEALLRVEAALVQHDRGARAPRAEQHVPDRLRPAGRGRAPDEVARARAEPALGLHALGEAVAV